MATTHLPLQLINLSLKHLDLIFLEGNPDLPVLLPLFQSLKAMNQLPLLVTILLHLHRQGLLSFLTTVRTIIQGGKVLVNVPEHVGCLLLSIME